MIARPYAIACALLLLGMFVAAAAIALHLQAIGAHSLALDSVMLFFIPSVTLPFVLMWLLVRGMLPRQESQRPAGILAVTYFAAAATSFFFVASKVLGMPWPGLNLLFAMLGGMMIVMGNIAGKLPHEHMMGFRSHWALADPEVWDKTQRFGGWVMVIAGFVVLNASLMLDLAAVNWITLAATCGGSISITLAARRFARQRRKARDAAWERLVALQK